MRSDNMPRPFAPEHGEEAASQLQRDIDLVDAAIDRACTTGHIGDAWQRLKPRLTPEREAAAAVPPERDWTMIQSGDASIPAWVVHYANAIGAYMKGQNVQHWAVGPVQSRNEAQQPAAAVPDGYALVPVEPTQGMLDAAGMCIVPDGKEWLDQSNRETWAAMLAANKVQP